MCLAPPLTQLNSYSVVMDAAPGPDTNIANLQLRLVADPEATRITGTMMVDVGANDSLISIAVSSAVVCSV